MKKYNFDQVIEIFKNNNCELLSKEYKNNTSILEYKCKCNNKIEMTFKKYLVQLCCNECHKKTLQRIYKYDFDQVKRYFEDKNCDLISTEYINNKTDLEYICECKNRSKITFKSFLDGQRCSKCAIEKRKITNLNIYGNECSMNSKEKIEQRKQNQTELTKKRKSTNLKKYGVEIATQNPIIDQKRQETNLEKYGETCALKLKEYDDKRKNTNIKRYGFEHPTQNNDVYQKQLNHRKQFKEHTLPSGKIVKIQGYEGIALDMLINKYNYKEEDILIDRKLFPKILYKYKNKNRRYFVDIFIPHENKIIEVKSKFTFRINIVQNMIKALYARKLGYEFEFWIIDRNELLCII
jgi:hypothetical protein